MPLDPSYKATVDQSYNGSPLVVGAAGPSNITAGTTSTTVVGLLYGDGVAVRVLPGTFSAASGYAGNIFTLGNDYQLALQTVGDVNTPMLELSVTSSAYGYGNMAEFYAVAGGINYLDTYIANNGAIYTSAYFVASGHTSGGPGFGRQMLLANNYIPSMFMAWSDIPGPAYLARDNQGIAGEFSFMGLTAGGVTTVAIDARNSAFAFGSQTIGSGQVFAPDGNISRLGAASLAIGNGAAGDTSGSLKLTTVTTVAIPFASLPASPTAGQRCVINNSTLAYSGTNIGSAAAGGGTYTAPVIYLSSWVIG